MPFTQRFDLSGRRALVTGASNGLGRAVAAALAGAGAGIVLHHASAFDARGEATRGSAGEAAAAFRGLGREVTVVDADLAAEDAPERIAAAAGGAVDVLVLNASVQCNRTIETITAADIDREQAVDWRASLLLLRAFLPGMAERGWGRVLFVGSVQIARPVVTSLSYAGLKAAMEAVMRGLAVQYAPFGVTCNTLSPGLIETNRSAPADRAAWRADGARRNPLGRVSAPDDYAAAALLLCSEAGAFITGANLYAAAGGQLAYRDDQVGRR